MNLKNLSQKKNWLKFIVMILVIGITGFLQATDIRIEGYLPVSQKHEIYYATYGNPQGIPVVILHGGPGAGCNEQIINFFDLSSWYVVAFDQRGAMRSRPFACMEENTTQHSIADIEALRKHLGIDQWVVFGCS